MFVRSASVICVCIMYVYDTADKYDNQLQHASGHSVIRMYT